jgi:nitroimidazol reductase NimA-like FMN-containing flavoprotein (pyridoxamine 5'-phosphate oxidase superfamily)
MDLPPTAGRLQHVEIRGRATVVPWDDARAARLLRRYNRHWDGYREPPAAPNEKTIRTRPMVFVRVEPETVVRREQSYRESLLAPPKDRARHPQPR